MPIRMTFVMMTAGQCQLGEIYSAFEIPVGIVISF